MIGAIGLNTVAATDIRDRYAFVADLLLYSSGIVTFLTLLVAAYLYLLDRPCKWIWSRAHQAWAMRGERAAFKEWVKKWAALTRLYKASFREEKSNEWWTEAEAEYNVLRPWLMQHERDAPATALTWVIDTLDAQWGHRTDIERKLAKDGSSHSTVTTTR